MQLGEQSTSVSFPVCLAVWTFILFKVFQFQFQFLSGLLNYALCASIKNIGLIAQNFSTFMTQSLGRLGYCGTLKRFKFNVNVSLWLRTWSL